MVHNSQNRQLATVAVFLVALAICLALTRTRVSYSGNEASRLAMVESLIERSTFAIDASPFVWTTDKVRIDGRFYCDKPPLLPVLSAGEAWLLKHIFGISFSSHPRAWVYLLTVFSVGLSAAWLAALFFADTGRLWGVQRTGARIEWTAAAWAGTLILTYCGTYNNHMPAAAFLYAGFSRFARLVKSGERPFPEKSLFLTGLFAGFCWAMDFSIGTVFLALFGLCVFVSERKSRRLRAVCWFALGAFLPIAATALINVAMVGDPRPLYFYKGAYDYSGSHLLGGGFGGTHTPHKPVIYIFHILFGYRGIFLYSPVLIPAVAGLIWYLRRGGERWIKPVAALVLVGNISSLAFYGLLTQGLGGWAYGFRYLVPTMPLLVFFLGPRWIEASGIRKRLFSVVLVISVSLAAFGNFNPWSPCYEGERVRQNALASEVKTPLAANLVLLRAFIDPESAPGSFFAKWLVDRDEAQAAAYMGISFLSRGDVHRAKLMFDYSLRLKPDPRIKAYIKALQPMSRAY